MGRGVNPQAATLARAPALSSVWYRCRCHMERKRERKEGRKVHCMQDRVAKPQGRQGRTGVYGLAAWSVAGINMLDPEVSAASTVPLPSLLHHSAASKQRMPIGVNMRHEGGCGR